MAANNTRYPWLWDVDMDDETFETLLSGRATPAQYDARWALLRLVEYAPYGEIKRLLPTELFLKTWPSVAPSVRSATRREGMDFVFAWLNARGGRHA